jgi:hypothetical protein
MATQEAKWTKLADLSEVPMGGGSEGSADR